MEEAGHEKRFASLLQPIKDLAATWNIDIAAELEQYLEELDQIEVTVESAGKFNFVEAALVVQGSTHVYSRKVELLHQLVYRALEHVVSKKESNNTRVKQVQSIEDHTHLLALKVPAGKDLEQGQAGDGTAVAPCLRRMPLFLMPREKTDRKRISHKIGGCAFLKSAVLLEESDAMESLPEGEGPASPLVPAPPMGMSTAKKKLREERRELAALETEAIPDVLPEPPAPPPPADDLPDFDLEPEDYEEFWVQMDPHENLGTGKPLKEGKTVAKPPARLLRPLSEITLTDPFGDSDLYEVGALKGTLRRLGLDDLADCEFLVVAELRRRRRAALEQARLSKDKNKDAAVPDLPDLDFDAEDGGALGPVGGSMEPVEPRTPDRLPAAGGMAPAIDVTPGSASKQQVAEIQKKLEAAQASYEAVVQARLQELDLFAGAQAGGLAGVYAAVRKWQDGLEPILAEQDERVPFDIHKYGAFLLEKIAEAKDQNIGFFQIVEGMPHWEVFRYFLAALVLTNNGNVDILNSADKSFALSLLEGERPYALEDNEMTGFKDDKASKEDQENKAPANEPAPKRAKKSEGAGRKAEMKAEPALAEKAEAAPAEAPAKRRRKAA